MDRAVIRDVFQWDVRTWSRALPVWQRWIDERRPRRMLAIGERNGGLSLWLGRQGIEVLCTDIRDPAPAARPLHARHGVQDRIRYAREDVTALTCRDGEFDAVIFKSVIGALRSKERQARAVAEMHRVLRPGGMLLFAENLAGSRIHGILRERFVRWEQDWRYVELSGDLDLFAPFECSEWYTTGLLASLGRSEGQRDLLARVDRVLCPVVPARWQYVIYGACGTAG